MDVALFSKKTVVMSPNAIDDAQASTEAKPLACLFVIQSASTCKHSRHVALGESKGALREGDDSKLSQPSGKNKIEGKKNYLYQACSACLT